MSFYSIFATLVHSKSGVKREKRKKKKEKQSRPVDACTFRLFLEGCFLKRVMVG